MMRILPLHYGRIAINVNTQGDALGYDRNWALPFRFALVIFNSARITSLSTHLTEEPKKRICPRMSISFYFEKTNKFLVN